ncbi:MAG TPA: Uma2 family endonuclease [Chthonomonadaceae bacterium]|nr:Uma2 family endonuclease [Chthonomonadaceae bacterium]
MTTARPTPSTRTPPLQNGDRLTRAEFKRRYDATPNLKKADGYVEDALELIFEVTASSVSYDLNGKWNVYRRNGVREYVTQVAT